MQKYFLKINVTGIKKDGIWRVMLKEVNYNKYNQFFISTIKGITKYHENITKDSESFFYDMKDQC